MKTFNYIAVNSKGEKVQKTIEGNSAEDVANTLIDGGLSPVKISEKIDFMQFMNGSAAGLKIPEKEKVIFLREFSTMISAGLPIDDALEVAGQQAENPAFRRILDEMTKDIRSGLSLAATLEKYPKAFNAIEVSLVKAGEVSGKMDVVAERLADDVEKSAVLAGKVRGALSYPIFVVVIAFSVVGLITVKLVPAMQALYAGFGSTSLPLPTEILIGLSNLITNYWLYLIIGIILAVVCFRYYTSTPEGLYVVHKLVLKVPIVGPLIAKYQIVTFIKTYSMLLTSGIPVITCLDLVGNALSNKVFSKAIQETSKEVEKGVSLAVSLSKHEFIPSILWRSIAVGEETGKTDEILKKVGSYFETQVNDSVNNLTRLLEPVLLVVLGSIVGFIAVAIYLPIYSFSSVVH